MPVRHILQIYKRFASEVGLVVVSFDGGHTVLKQMLHPLRNTIKVVFTLLVGIVEELVVLKKWFEPIHTFRRTLISLQILLWCEFWNEVNHVI